MECSVYGSYQELPAHLSKVTIGDIRKAAKDFLRPDKLAIVVVGDKSLLENGLTELISGPIQLRNTLGDPL